MNTTGILFDEQPMFPIAEWYFAPKLYSGKLIACETAGDNNYDLEDDLFKIETNVAW